MFFAIDRLICQHLIVRSSWSAKFGAANNNTTSQVGYQIQTFLSGQETSSPGKQEWIADNRTYPIYRLIGWGGGVRLLALKNDIESSLGWNLRDCIKVVYTAIICY